ncbi:MAG: 30S ribosomal protein S6 [Candidatus Auribacterota bacterium]|jgi:small subunit ribosomal protein S6|nr:30S ribosomal protein S6 [Candidatus Auribacterota bacterium]
MNKGYYEAMFIINTGDDDESPRNAVIDEIVAEVKKNKGTVLRIEPLGKKQFTYSIAKKRDGYYYLVYLDIDTQAIHKMKEKFKINSRILREMFIRLEKEPQFDLLEERKPFQDDNAISDDDTLEELEPVEDAGNDEFEPLDEEEELE